MDYFYLKTPFGNIKIETENKEIVSLRFCNEYQKTKENEFQKEIERQLCEYFQSKRKTFDLKINPKGTIFQKTIWQKLKEIPYGKTASYQEIAKAINKPLAHRATASACAKNPILIIIPCHRVISKNGSLNNYSGGKDLKERLLNLEGAL